MENANCQVLSMDAIYGSHCHFNRGQLLFLSPDPGAEQVRGSNLRSYPLPNEEWLRRKTMYGTVVWRDDDEPVAICLQV